MPAAANGPANGHARPGPAHVPHTARRSPPVVNTMSVLPEPGWATTGLPGGGPTANSGRGDGGGGMREQAAYNAMVSALSRSTMFRGMLDPRRSIEDECGFPPLGAAIPPEFYDDLYQREPVPARVVELKPSETWQVTPEVVEDDGSDVSTAFEEAWDQVGRDLRTSDGGDWFDGDGRHPAMWVLEQADVDARRGRYGVLLLGFDDGLPLWVPVRGVAEDGSTYAGTVRTGEKGEGVREARLVAGYPADPEPAAVFTPQPDREWDGGPLRYSLQVNRVGRDRPTGNADRRRPGAGKQGGRPGPGGKSADQAEQPLRLVSLRSFPERFARVLRYETNPLSPRYGRPTAYQITLTDPEEAVSGSAMPAAQTVDVHWTRVIHVCERGERGVFHIPPMKQVLNNLLGIRKIDAASPEAVWKGAIQLMVVSTLPTAPDMPVDSAQLKDMIEEVDNGFQRWMLLRGLQVNSVPPTVIDPKAHSDNQIEKICIKEGCPVPVFKGYEIGEQASENNDADWRARVRQRQHGHATLNLVCPLVNRLIWTGVLPEPQAGTYKVRWPDNSRVSAADKAAVMAQRTTAWNTYLAGPMAQAVAPQDFATKFDWLDDGQAEAVIKAGQKWAEDQRQEQLRQQADDALAQQQYGEQIGMVPDGQGGYAPPPPEPQQPSIDQTAQDAAAAPAGA